MTAYASFRTFPSALQCGIVEPDGLMRLPAPAFSSTVSTEAGSLKPSTATGAVAPWCSARLARMVLAELPRDYSSCPASVLTPAQSHRRLVAAKAALSGVLPLPGDAAVLKLVTEWASDLLVRGYGLSDGEAQAVLMGFGLSLDTEARGGSGRWYRPGALSEALDEEAERAERETAANALAVEKAATEAMKTTPTSASDLDGVLFLIRDDEPALAELSAAFLPRGSYIKALGDGTSLHATKLPIEWPAGEVQPGWGRSALRVCDRSESFPLTEFERTVAASSQTFAGAAALGRLRRDRAVLHGRELPVTEFTEPGTAAFRAALRRAGELITEMLPSALEANHVMPVLPMLDVIVRGLQLEPAIVAKLVSDAARAYQPKSLSSPSWEDANQVSGMAATYAIKGICTPGELRPSVTIADVVDPAFAVFRNAFGSKDHASTSEAIDALNAAGITDAKGGPGLFTRISAAMSAALGWESTKVIDPDTGKARHVYKRVDAAPVAAKTPAGMRPFGNHEGPSREQLEAETLREVAELRARLPGIAGR